MSAEILRELTYVKALFQMRTLSAHMGIPAQAIEAFGQDAKRLDGEATKARSRKGCAQGRD